MTHYKLHLYYQTIFLALLCSGNINAMENSALDIPTQFHDLIRNDSLETLRSLITAENIHTKDEHGNTALHFVAFHNSVEAGKIFLDFGAKINTKNLYGDTPLHYAVDMQHPEITELFLHQDIIQVNAQNNNGDTPLHIAIQHHWNNVCDIDITPEKQLLVAQKDKNILMIIEWLLGSGADQSLKNKKRELIDYDFNLNGSASRENFRIYKEKCTLYLHSLLLYQRLYLLKEKEEEQSSSCCCIQC
jgi:Ankyrin repeats (3 copies)